MIFRGTKNSIIDKIAPIARNICPILAFSGFPESLGSSGFLHMDSLANQGMLGWDQIRKFIPLDWSVIFRWTKKSSINKIAFIGRNTCPILAFNGFPESPGSSASFLYGRLANQRIGSHPKILPTRFVSDFQAAALLPRAAATSITRVLTQGRKDNVLPYVRPELFNTMYNGR